MQQQPSEDSSVRIKQRITNVKFVVRLYTRDNSCHDSDDRICLLNDELDYLEMQLEQREQAPIRCSKKCQA